MFVWAMIDAHHELNRRNELIKKSAFLSNFSLIASPDDDKICQKAFSSFQRLID